MIFRQVWCAEKGKGEQMLLNNIIVIAPKREAGGWAGGGWI